MYLRSGRILRHSTSCDTCSQVSVVDAGTSVSRERGGRCKERDREEGRLGGGRRGETERERGGEREREKEGECVCVCVCVRVRVRVRVRVSEGE